MLCRQQEKCVLDKKSIDDIEVRGKRVLVRCDFNVPMVDGVITDVNRLEGAIPTISTLVKRGAKVILCSHMGKPKGEPIPELSLAPVAERLSEMMGQKIHFAADNEVTGTHAKAAVAAMKEGEVVLLENTRYRAEETQNSDLFSQELASLADIFVNDAFGTAHRAHCSNVGVTRFVDTSVLGYLVQKEIAYLGSAIMAPERPLMAILGGAKVSDKIKVIDHLLEKIDSLVIGGGMAYTFLKAMGHNIGKSILDEERLTYALQVMEKAKKRGVKLLLPVDHVVAKSLEGDAPIKIALRGEIEEEWESFDIGPVTRTQYAEAISEAKTIVWNGPMGVFERESFAKGTYAVAKAIAESGATSIIGGGDSVAAVNQMGYNHSMSHISTGGGASLEYLEGKALPGILAADDR